MRFFARLCCFLFSQLSIILILSFHPDSYTCSIFHICGSLSKTFNKTFSPWNLAKVNRPDRRSRSRAGRHPTAEVSVLKVCGSRPGDTGDSCCCCTSQFSDTATVKLSGLNKLLDPIYTSCVLGGSDSYLILKKKCECVQEAFKMDSRQMVKRCKCVCPLLLP